MSPPIIPRKLQRFGFTFTVGGTNGNVIAPDTLGDVAPSYWDQDLAANVAMPVTAIPVYWELFNNEASGGETLRFFFAKAPGTANVANLTDRFTAATPAGAAELYQVLPPQFQWSSPYRHPDQQVDDLGNTTAFFNALAVKGATPATVALSGYVEAWLTA